MDITVDDINNLATKLEALELTETEAAVLDAVLAQASADDEVAGFEAQMKMEVIEFKGLKSGGMEPKSMSKKATYLFDAFSR